MRSPDASTARLFLKRGLRYSLLLIDAQLPDATGRELADFVQSLEHCKHLPIHVLPPGGTDINDLSKTLARLLALPAR